MEKISICIMDNDEHYKKALVTYMKSYCSNYLVNIPDIALSPDGDGHTDEMLKSIICSGDILLISYDCFETLRRTMSEDLTAVSDKIIVLLESAAKRDEKDITGFVTASKYTDIPKIIETIDYNFNSMSAFLTRMPVKLVLCLGLSGGSGTSSVAYGIAAELAKYREKRVFFLSMDVFETGVFKGERSSYERIIYSLLSSGFSNEGKMIENNITRTDEWVFRMPMSIHRNPFLELNRGEKEQYIKEIGNADKFDYIVVDGSNKLDEFTDYLMANSHDMIFVDSHRSLKKHYMADLTDYAANVRFAENEMILVENFMENSDPCVYENAIPIRLCSGINGESMINNLSFRADVKKLVDYLG